MFKDDCIFCQIAQGKSPCHKIWEDDEYLAFLSIFPNTEGFSVLIPKQHYPSYVFDLPDDILCGLTLAAKKVGKLLDSRFTDVGRTAMIYEGFGVDHVHAKLIPMHGTKNNDWQPIESKNRKYFKNYEGYICSNDYNRADDKSLSDLAKKISSK